MASVQTSSGPAAAVAVSADTLTDADKAAILAADQHNTPGSTPAAPPPPADNLIAGKFKSQEDLVKAYEESQRKITELSQGKPPAPAADPAAPEGDPNDLTIQEAAEAATGNPNAFDKFSQEYAENRALSDASYDELGKMGISREMVDYYIRGQEAAAADFTGQVFNAVGGADAYKEVVTWAASNLPKAEQDAYNAAVNSGNPAQASLAASGLKARYDAANGVAPRLLSGDSVGSASSDVYTNYAQVVEVMGTSKYKNDPDYRAQVDAKIMRSPLS